MSPIDDYYEVLDYINYLETECGRSKIDNTHKMSKHLNALLLLASIAEAEHWRTRKMEDDEE